ncbi:hypothetical protein OG729_10150 [Streptomyces sp. NBC_00210]|uniref:hypothetical protein n=1 Tax=Streptomyces sp. NBC_00210 TaxID=2903636 RepID=UPI003248CB85
MAAESEVPADLRLVGEPDLLRPDLVRREQLPELVRVEPDAVEMVEISTPPLGISVPRNDQETL